MLVAVTRGHGREHELKPFVVPTPGKVISTGSGECEATELWILDATTGRKELLVAGRDDDDPKKVIADISDPILSLKQDAIYFETAAWMVSGAIHRVDLKTKKISFVIDGSIVGLIPTGRYAGSLLVERALIKFDANGESLGRDIYLWLVSPDGNIRHEIGLVYGAAAEGFVRRHLPQSAQEKPNDSARRP